MSRHTTSFTTDPIYRARQELRNRLERIQQEAQTTASCVGAFPGNELEEKMWQALDAMCSGYINGIDQINQSERDRKNHVQSVGRDLADFEGREPA